MSLFGASSSAATATGFPRSSSFPAQPAAPKPAFSFGGTTAPSAAEQKPGGLFSSTAGAPTSGTGLFGAQSNAPQPQKPAGGLFGMQAQQPPANTSFFGASQPAQPPGTTAGGLFGNSQQAQQPAQAGTGFFGATQTSAPTGGLFGSSAQPSNTGNLATNTQPATGGLFGAQPKPFGTSTLPFNAQPVAHASPLMQSNFYQRERFNELPEPQQKVLEEMEKFITGQVQIKNELHARDQSTDMRHLMAGIQDFRSMQEALSASLEADTMRVQSIATSVGKDRDDNVHLYQIATNAKDRLSDGASFVDWLRQFYEGAADDFVVRIQRYRVTMEQIERHLLSLEQREQFAPQVIAEIINDQNASFMALAEQIATLHAEIDTLKKDYVKWYQARFHSVRDPFAPKASAAQGP